MKKILMVGTGGTIASEMTAEGLAPELNTEQLLEFIPDIGKFCRVDCLQLYNLDSTNIRPADWLGVADILRRDPAKRRAVRRDKAYAALRSPWLHALLERMRIEGCYSAYYLPCRWRSIRLVWVMAETRRTGSPLFGKLDWAGYYLLGRRLRRD